MAAARSAPLQWKLATAAAARHCCPQEALHRRARTARPGGIAAPRASIRRHAAAPREFNTHRSFSAPPSPPPRPAPPGGNPRPPPRSARQRGPGLSASAIARNCRRAAAAAAARLLAADSRTPPPGSPGQPCEQMQAQAGLPSRSESMTARGATGSGAALPRTTRRVCLLRSGPPLLRPS